MGAEPIIADSARQHGVTDDDMLRAYRNPMRVFDLDDGLTMIIPSRTAILFEVGVVEGDSLVIVHRDAGTREVPEVRTMPRSVEDILKHADELAKRFEDYEPKPKPKPKSEDVHDTDAVDQLRHAVTARSDAERSIRDAVDHAREAGLSWAFIGSLIGTSGEAARQRYGQTHRTDR